MLNGGSMIWGFCVYFVYMIPLETDVLRKHRFQKPQSDVCTCIRRLTVRMRTCVTVCERLSRHALRHILLWRL